MSDVKPRPPREEVEAPAPPTIPMPSIGRSVLYTTPDGLTWPAIVSEVDLMQPTVLGLTVFGMQGPSVADVVSYDADGACGTWRWPEYTIARN